MACGKDPKGHTRPKGQIGVNPIYHLPSTTCRSWRDALADAITDPAELCRLLGLPPPIAPTGMGCRFPMRVPRSLVARIRPGDPSDPWLLQVLPREAEDADQPGFTADPVAEVDATQTPGLLAKYQNRLLIVASGRCGVHCRFCFRRHFPYANSPRTPEDWEAILGEVAASTSTREVILSGGDPLTLDDNVLAWLAERLAAIPHLSRLRVHTRLPIVIPERITDELLAWLRGTRLTPLVVVHVNHPVEIDDAVARGLARLVDAGIVVLSQSVLLRGVNDRVEVLAGLFERLADLRVMPYYLHQLDRVAGAAHFEVPEAEGISLIEQLRARLPGYAVPRYVRQPPEGLSKRVLA
jgi:L-lysine 2,3-aminomutase